MKITVQITVPDGDKCNGCKQLRIDQTGVWKCIMFDKVLQDGWSVKKCDKCREAKGVKA